MSRTEAKQWMLRVDEKLSLEQTVERIAAFYVWSQSDGFVVREESDPDNPNPHYHFYIEGCQKESTMRAKVKIFFGVQGNKEYSMKEMCDPPRYMRYLCKGPGHKHDAEARQQPVVVYRKGPRFTEELLRVEHEAFWNERATQTAKQTRKVIKESKTQRMVGEALEHFRDRCTPDGQFVDPEDGVWKLTNDVLSYIVGKLCDKKEASLDHWIIGVTNTVVSTLSKESKETYISHLFRRMRNL